MSDHEELEKAAGLPKRGGGLAGMILGMIVPGLISAGASYGAVRAATKGMHAGGQSAESAHVKEEKPPGPTVALEPFLVNIPDANKRTHPMKITLAVEFGGAVKEDTLKIYIPRIRDAMLAHMRALAYEDAYDNSKSEKLRTDLLEKCKAAGATTAERVLITDMVSQ